MVLDFWPKMIVWMLVFCFYFSSIFRLTNETPSKKNYALYRALVELKWAKTSIHRVS